jgi:hypothetical protein
MPIFYRVWAINNLCETSTFVFRLNRDMFKFLLVLGLLFYVVYKVSSFFFKAGAASQQFRNPPPQARNASQSGTSKKGNGNIKGGEYIDYEEVK